MNERISGNGRIDIARRMALLGLMVAAFAVAFLGSPGGAGAQPITVPSDGWTRENFADSCRKAGGRVVEIDSPGIKYSKCYFPDGGVNKCDWIKKTCTFALVPPATGTHIDLNATGGLVVSDGSTGSTGGKRDDIRATTLQRAAVVRAPSDKER